MDIFQRSCHVREIEKFRILTPVSVQDKEISDATEEKFICSLTRQSLIRELMDITGTSYLRVSEISLTCIRKAGV